MASTAPPRFLTEIPERVEIAGAAVFDVIVDLIRSENELREINGGEDSISERLAGTACDVYQAAFGEMFVDNDEDSPELPWPECCAPLYRLAEERATIVEQAAA
jgi:hypothetical protein